MRNMSRLFLDNSMYALIESLSYFCGSKLFESIARFTPSTLLHYRLARVVNIIIRSQRLGVSNLCPNAQQRLILTQFMNAQKTSKMNTIQRTSAIPGPISIQDFDTGQIRHCSISCRVQFQEVSRQRLHSILCQVLQFI